MIKRIPILLLSLCSLVLYSQKGVYYSGKTLSNVDYHDGQLAPAVGTHNIQTFRANREFPTDADDLGWTYNHAPMLAYWNNTFYLEYLSSPKSEHVPPGRTFLQTSKDGYTWSKPTTLFPEYKVPDGTTKEGHHKPAKNLKAFIHQRVGFFTSKNGVLLAITYYGICLDAKDDPNDGNGIGRVVREINKNGSWGPIYFVYYNHGFNESNTDYPYYQKSKNKDFIAACDEMLNSPLALMQWVEESDRNDPLIPLARPFKAFSYYHLNDGRVVGLWKQAISAISNDGGKTWPDTITRAPGFVNSNAKIWGQKTSDGKYATVYNPSEYRWPLAISTSVDGLNYEDMYLVHGGITEMRYGGNYKTCGPQYVRGIQENNGIPPDGNMWVTYSLNKEDIWVSKIPIPVTDKATSHADDVFDDMPMGNELNLWNIYSPQDASVKINKKNGKRCLVLSDSDPFDYAMAERIIPESKSLNASFSIIPAQNNEGNLQIEFQDHKGSACTRIIFDSDSLLKLKVGARYKTLLEYKPNKEYKIKIHLETQTRTLTLKINDNEIVTKLFFNPISSIERVVFRTGNIPTLPTPNTPADRYSDLLNANARDPEAKYYISYLRTSNPSTATLILDVDKFKHYVDYYNTMEDENIVSYIPNSQSWDWMKQNIPWFECPQKNFEEIYYFRWWSFRKHIINTPLGFAITEFLVPRNYADKYNLIACAIGHHVMEGRWLKNSDYVNQDLHVWYRGENGNPMSKLYKFSSWSASAAYAKYKVDGDKDFLLGMYPDFQKDFTKWNDNLLPSGLYWQGDVQDGMEESLSGGRHKRYARPTINSYMYGNAMALANMSKLKGDKKKEQFYNHEADRIRSLVQDKLWNVDSSFFETLRKPDQFAQVREAIGFIPWYFNLPNNNVKKFENAWLQIRDTKGFMAPYGLTTAERRHPEFRTHGVGKCEWDGAVWPFASSQTIVALANYMNSTNRPIIGDSTYFSLMQTYVESQYHRGRPYIGEYLDEVTGYWLKGDQERSRYYNHSTFADLIITGLIGLRPRADQVLEINPLIPQDQWDWFCLDGVRYHGRDITILWDKTGEKYRRGKGFQIFVNGKCVARSSHLERLVYSMN